MADVNDDGSLPYRKDGFIDPKTGMYTVPEAAVNQAEFEKQGDMWVPVPKQRPCRAIAFHTPYAQLHVVESMDNVRNMIETAARDDSPGWFQFIDPTFGTTMAVPRDTLRRVAWVCESFVDLEKVKDDLAMQEFQRLQTRLQLAQAGKRRN